MFTESRHDGPDASRQEPGAASREPGGDAGLGAGAEEASEPDWRAEVAALQEQLLRVRADTDNYRKRLERTTEDLIKDAKRGIFLSILGVVDDLERALAAVHGAADGESLAQGVELTLRRLRDVLAAQGVTALESPATFDPRYHEAVAQVPTREFPDGAIVDELERGYVWGEEVLRAARVRVAVPIK